MEYYEDLILKAVNYVEAHICDNISLEEIAKVVGFSKFHFTRLFKGMTRETINEYIRKRRLTLAARALIDTTIPIFQIGLDAGYNSQEAFTRAFKMYMGISPQKYRNGRVHYFNLYKEYLKELHMQMRKQPISYEVTMIEKPAIYIGGIALRENVNNLLISQLWNRFCGELHKVSIDPDQVACYGYESLDHEDLPYYLAAIPLDSPELLPAGWTGVHIPAHKYIAFTLNNVIEHIPYAVEEIYKFQLPMMNLKPASNFSFEFYEEDYVANHSNYTLQIYIPIEEEK